MVFFESVHRISATLSDMVDAFGVDRPAFIGRELTKLHEQCATATLGGLAGQISDTSIVSKGEFVIVVSGSQESTQSSLDVDGLLLELIAVMPARQAAAIAARVTGSRRNALYQRILTLGDGS